VRQLTPSRGQRIRQLLTIEEMGDRKPSQFLRHLRSLAPDVSDDFLSTIWSSRLPPNIQAHLACQPECSLNVAARCADRISEVAPQPAVASVSPTPNSVSLKQEIEDLTRQVASLSAERDRLRASIRDLPVSRRDHYPSSPEPRTRTRDPRPTPGTAARTAVRPPPTLCWYYRRFGAAAQKCTPPCTYHQHGYYSSRHHRRHMSAPQRRVASSLLTDTINGNS
jgi:hypothetical protein